MKIIKKPISTLSPAPFQTTADPTDAIISQISGYIRVGASYLLAATACGVPESTAKNWWKTAEKAKDGVYRGFYESMRVAKAQAEVIALQRLSAEGGASGAKTVLEIINPEKYGKNKKTQEDISEEVDFGSCFNNE